MTTGSHPVTTVQLATTKPGASIPQWQDISAYVMRFVTFHGRTYETDQVQPGTCTLTLDNTDRRFDPMYTAGAYYPNVLPRKRIRVSTVWSGTTYYLFDGYVDRWPQVYEGPDNATVTVTARDAFLPLNNAIITGSFVQELSGARIAEVLAAAQWPSSTPVASGGYWTLGTSQLGVNNRLGYGVPTTVLDAGQKQVQAATFVLADQRAALAHIQDVAGSENGIFFVDGQGRLIYHDGLHRIRSQTAAVTLTDDASLIDATHVGYENIVTSFDYDHGANDVTVTADGGVAQNVVDGQAIEDYFRTGYQRSVLLTSDSEAANLARLLLRQLKDVRDVNGLPRIRVDSVTVKPWTNDQWTPVLAREISDRVTVTRNPATHPVGPVEAISTDCYIESIRHEGADSEWLTTFQLSPASPASDFWVLGTSRLGTTTVLAF